MIFGHLNNFVFLMHAAFFTHRILREKTLSITDYSEIFNFFNY